MPSTNSWAGSNSLDAAQLLAIERCCDRFEDAWRSGQRPQLAEYLADAGTPAMRLALLRELIATDVEARRLNGESPAQDDYQRLFPDDGEAVREAMDYAVADARTITLPRPTVMLEVISGPHQGLAFAYDRHDTLVVGRGGAAGLQLVNDPHFSRHHFLLEFNPPLVYLRDLGSSNGTLVNGKPVAECFLSSGDEISCGKTRIRVSLPNRPARDVSTLDQSSRKERMDSVRSEAVTCPAASKVEELPTFIPGYDVLRQLGAGGMGSVYLARSWSTGGEFALKLMLPESAVSERAMRLFLREVQVLSKLEHPNVVRYYEMGTTLGQFYFIMEYVPSSPLAELCTGLSPEERTSFVCSVAAQALSGLAYAHGKGFVHRDIKPANLLVDTSGTAVRVKVSDFGLAKSFQNAGFSGMTLSGQVMGTLAFMAPEQMTHCRTAKPSADLYSVGATMYSLISGRHPLDIRSGRDPVRVLMEDEPLPIEGLCPWLPRPVAEIIHRALRKKPEHRFPDAAAMRAVLMPFVTGN